MCSSYTYCLFRLDTRLRGHMLRRYYSRRSIPRHILAEPIRVISLIRHDSLTLHILYQRISLRNVVFFACRQDEPQRVAQSVNARMHLRAEPTPASA